MNITKFKQQLTMLGITDFSNIKFVDTPTCIYNKTTGNIIKNINTSNECYECHEKIYLLSFDLEALKNVLNGHLTTDGFLIIWIDTSIEESKQSIFNKNGSNVDYIKILEKI